jgi:hypothetical protein
MAAGSVQVVRTCNSQLIEASDMPAFTLKSEMKIFVT